MNIKWKSVQLYTSRYSSSYSLRKWRYIQIQLVNISHEGNEGKHWHSILGAMTVIRLTQRQLQKCVFFMCFFVVFSFDSSIIYTVHVEVLSEVCTIFLLPFNTWLLFSTSLKDTIFKILSYFCCCILFQFLYYVHSTCRYVIIKQLLCMSEVSTIFLLPFNTWLLFTTSLKDSIIFLL